MGASAVTAALAHQHGLQGLLGFLRAFSSTPAAFSPGLEGTVAGKFCASPRDTGGIFKTVAGIVHQQGFGGLFRGLGPRVMLATPSAALSWGTYETVRNALSAYWM
jgi:hypothetical protein